MKKLLITIIALIFSSGLFAQGVYNNGAKIVIGSGVTLYVGGSYINEAAGSNKGAIHLSGKLKIEANYINNVPDADVLAVVEPTSEVIFTGNSDHLLTGATAVPFTFQNLTIDNPVGVVALNTTTVNGVLTINNGLFKIGIHDFIFGPSATIAGNPSASAMLVTTGTGIVKKQFIAPGSFTFPVGNNFTIPQYSPLTLTFTGGTFAEGAFVGVNLVNAAYSDPYIAGSYLNRYWNVTQTGITDFTCDAAFNYPIADIVGTESDIYCVRINPAPVSLFNPTNTTLHQLTATGLTSFGTFTGALGLRNLNLTSVLLQGLYNGAGTMRQAWDAVGPHWPADVADHITVELHDATNYASIVNTILDVPLSITGTASMTIPATYNSSYYITIKHRNSLETTTVTAIPFAGETINQSFGAPADVFGGNLGISTDGQYFIYAGDVNQDDALDLGDLIPVGNEAAIASSGYIPEDINGDGVVDLSDLIIIGNNAAIAIGAIVP